MLRRGPKPKADLYEDVCSSANPSTGTVDYTYYATETGGFLRGEVINVPSQQPRVSSLVADEYANWIPFHDKRPSNLQHQQTNDEDADAASDIEDTDTTSEEKRKRYESSDDPNRVWSENAIELLHELFHFDGLGDALNSPCCTTCTTTPPGSELFRCQDCFLSLECATCCILRHNTAPLHRIKKWNGKHFESITLQNLGLIYHLGHGGLPCPSPDPMVRKMTILDTNGIHTISFTYCECHAPHSPINLQQLMRAGWYPATTTDPRTCATFNVLDLYRRLNVQANVNANDFVKTLLKLTDGTGTTKLPDRYVTFARMARQWALLHRIKRSGVGFTLLHLRDILPGSLAVVCWACPNPDLNLPPDWETRLSKYWYRWMPILALDANFRLKNKFRANERPNPSLAPGSAYFVEPTAYKDFLKDYVSENDISTCIAFAALLEKDTKLTTGLKTSGVGGCACARHELIRPLGLGDLQKGERYANMDFIFFSAVMGIRLPRIGVSYDIICQWKQKLWERMLRLPKQLHLNPETTSLTFGLPTWHAAAHELSCRTTNALTYQTGVGRTDGEGIERIWSVLNPASYATKEMSEGVRHDTLDDKVDSHNYHKNITLGRTLSRRLEVALAERDRQRDNFDFYDKRLSEEKRQQYLKRIHDWNADRNNPSPYMPTSLGNVPTEDEVRASLAADELKEAQAAQAPVYGTSMSAFLVAGFQLEDLQLKLHRDIAGIGRGTPYQHVKIDQRRLTFFDKLESFRDLQRTYMPGVKRIIQQQVPSPNGDSEAAENIRLWFPSDLPINERPTGCSTQLVELEAQFREARCHDALVHLRHYLHSKKYLLAFRNANVTGQNESTKARGLIDTIGDRIDAEAEKYRRSRQALLSLYEAQEHEDYPELTQADTTLDVVDDPDIQAVVKLSNTNSSSHRRPHVSTGTKTVSWIWTALGGPTEEEDIGIGESVSIEWSKALAQKNRWSEEVVHLRDEMKRVLRGLDTLATSWEIKVPSAPHPSHVDDTAVIHGMQAYASHQANVYRRLRASFRQEWGR